VIEIKILGTKSHMRYAVKRLVVAARDILRLEYPDIEIAITEINDVERILKYTPVLIAPALVINEKLVYDLWIPKKEQVIDWLREAIQKQLSPSKAYGESEGRDEKSSQPHFSR
jgi:hypothetical protein